MIQKVRGRARARGLIVLTTAPLLGVVIPVLGVHEPAKADGPVRVGAKKHYKASHRHRPGKGHAAKPGRFVINTNGPKSPILPGRTYNWPFAVTNKGPMRAGPAILKAPLPKQLEFVSGAANCSFAGNAAVCQLGSMKPGQTVAGVITAKVATAVKPREAINTAATVSWSRSSVSKAFPPVSVADTADLSVTKTAPSAVRPGQAIPYEVTVRNSGPSAAAGVEVSSALPLKVSPGSSQACAGESRGGKPHGGGSGACASGHSEAGVKHSSGQVCAGENEAMPNGQGTSGQGGNAACVHGHSQGGVDHANGELCAGMPQNGQNGTGTNGQSSNGQTTNGQTGNGESTGQNGTGENGNENHAACASSRGESGTGTSSAPVDVIEAGNGCLQRSMSFVCSVGSLSAGEERTFKIRVRPGKKIRPGVVVEWPSKVTTKTIELNLGNNAATAKTKVKGPGAAKAGMALQKVKPGKAKAHRPGVPAHRPGAPGRAPGQRPGGPIWHGGVPGGGMKELPRTGAESGAMFDASLGLIGVGLILTRLGRRSRRD